MAEVPETLVATPPPAPAGATLLGDETLRVVVSERGTGLATYEGRALYRGSEDPRDDDGGWAIYLDEPGRAPWSIAAWPCYPAAGARATASGPVFTRSENDLDATLTVAAFEALEVRRVTLVNRAAKARTIGVTGAFDVVLHDVEADRAHPAFSRLFVQTAWDASRGAVTASRRARGAGESFPHLACAVLEDKAPENDTDRARFRGRTTGRDRPQALLAGGPLAGTVGNVLDPVAALRVVRTLAPGAALELTFVLAAAGGRDDALRAIDEARANGAPPAPLPAAPVRTFEGVAPRAVAAPTAVPDGEGLLYWNGSGGFAPSGREYVIRGKTPQPWVNVLANEQFGCLVSESGAGATWSVNSRERRLTPWSNDPLLDPPGEAVYVQDEATGAYLSPWPGPAPGAGAYEVRHGFGKSTCRVEAMGLALESTVFVAPHDPVKVTRVRVTNTGAAPRRLALVAWQRLVLGGLPGETREEIVTARDARTGALLAERPDDPLHPARVAVATLVGASTEYAFTCDGAAFLGEPRDPARPALAAGTFDGRAGQGLDPCFAQRVAFELAPGAAATWDVVLGDAADGDEARALVRRFRTPGACTLALEEALRSWEDLVSAVQVTTPSPALDLMLNGWLVDQTLACRIWGRTAFFQSGGAFGYRDQLQDASALLAYRPMLFREQILLHAAHQFEEGDVLHWWHDGDRGLRTRFADDLLWLPWLLSTYVHVTADTGVLDERTPYLVAPLLAEDEHEVFLEATVSPRDADVYTHACAAIERVIAVGNGAHGLPLFGSGDWNDGMNRVGQAGKGESVWMGFFLATVLRDFAPLCALRGDTERAVAFALERARLEQVLEAQAWDGAWYRRGTYDVGAWLGSGASDECKIDALAQSWAVLSGVAPKERADSALDAVERELVVPEAGIVKLLSPPFEHSAHDPGYIKGYVPGVRENGGQYTHAALWYVRALAEAGRRDRAAHLLEAMSPVSHAQNAAQVARYQVEPYVIAADVYGAEPHVGRGGWTWYTGSAGWMIRVALESVLGLTQEAGKRFVLAPCVPDAWPGFTITRRLEEGTIYEFHVKRGEGASEGIVAATLDGAALEPVAGRLVVPFVRDGGRHVVHATLGPRP
jgi:cyclic beta-1,2-glucan synthetase